MSHINEAVTETKTLGFWIYLMTDCVLFATLFATYAVLQSATADGPSASHLFEMPFVLAETMILLASSFTVGLGVLLAARGYRRGALLSLVVTFLLGATFLTMELTEFAKFSAEGAGWTTSAFLSAFFVLVGTHGAHIAVGLLWMAVMMFRLWKYKGKQVDIARLGLLGLFWHFLDIVWIFIFTFVYLMGHMGGVA